MLNYVIQGWRQMSFYRKVRRLVMIGLAIFGLWALTPYLYSREVNEEFPAAVPIAQATSAPTSEAPIAQATSAPTAKAQLAEPTAVEAAEPTAVEVAEPTAVEVAEPTAVVAEPTAVAAEPTAVQVAEPTAVVAEPTAEPTVAAPIAPTTLPTAVPTVAATAEPAGPVVLARGSFVGGPIAIEQASGSATIYQLADNQRVLRLEEFAADNGPDLFVVLSSNANPVQDGVQGEAFVQLAALKGNRGNQNYELPADLDLTRYRSVVVWCRAFNVVFGYAPLQP